MTDTERPTPVPKPWIRRRTNQIGIALLLFLIWSLAANQWTNKGCDAIPQSYGLAITHFGTPDHYQGCDLDGAYTDDYAGD